MCKKETYKRFNKLYEIHKNYPEFAKTYPTKMGDREVVVKKFLDNTIYIIYKDFDGSTLFHIEIYKNGKVHIYKTKVDPIAIYTALYEIETIIYREKEERDLVLEKLFEKSLFYSNMRFNFNG